MAMPQGVPYGAGAIGPDVVSQGYPPAPQGVLAPPMGELSGLEGVPMPPSAGVAPPAYLSGGDMDERCTVLAPGGRDLDLRTGGLSPPRDRWALPSFAKLFRSRLVWTDRVCTIVTCRYI